MTAAGTYTVPAHSPEIDASMNNEFKIVLRRSIFEKSATKGCQILQELTISDFCFQRCGSVTPWRTQESSSAGNPPTANI